MKQLKFSFVFFLVFISFAYNLQQMKKDKSIDLTKTTEVKERESAIEERKSESGGIFKEAKGKKKKKDDEEDDQTAQEEVPLKNANGVGSGSSSQQKETTSTEEKGLNNINGSDLSQNSDPTAKSEEKPLVSIVNAPLPAPPLPKPIQVTSEMPDVNLNNDEGINTLLELPLDYSTNLIYYFPYFYKTHLISLPGEVSTTALETDCLTPNCSKCTNDKTCKKCNTGFILFGEKCVKSCPKEYIADNLRGICIPARIASKSEVVSHLAYSVGSCKNMCGNNTEDCSCSITCKNSGNCCTDYDSFDCQNIFNNAGVVDPSKCQENNGCMFCDNKKTVEISGKLVPYCNQCKETLWYLNGTCVEKCPTETVEKKTNHTCETKPICNVESCQTCHLGSTSECKTCNNGTFKFNNTCVNVCPENYRADRITWTCQEVPVFAWYWVFPSRTSCKTNCGIVIQEDWDCSCDFRCFHYGNCCQDIEDFCPDLLFWRKSNKLKKRKMSQNNTKENHKTRTKEKANTNEKKEIEKTQAFLKKKAE